MIWKNIFILGLLPVAIGKSGKVHVLRIVVQYWARDVSVRTSMELVC